VQVPKLNRELGGFAAVGERQFQLVDGLGQLGSGRLTQEQVNMLRHHNISINAQLETTARVLQAVNKQIEHLERCEIGPTAVALKGEASSGRLSPLPKSRAKPRDPSGTVRIPESAVDREA